MYACQLNAFRNLSSGGVVANVKRRIHVESEFPVIRHGIVSWSRGAYTSKQFIELNISLYRKTLTGNKNLYAISQDTKKPSLLLCLAIVCSTCLKTCALPL